MLVICLFQSFLKHCNLPYKKGYKTKIVADLFFYDKLYIQNKLNDNIIDEIEKIFFSSFSWNKMNNC